ncbi:MAG: molybdopterin molybdotransferase MoeA [Thermoguttaceae bacterium]
MDSTRRLTTPDEALTLVIETAETLGSQTLAVAAACGLTLAEPIAADRDYPPFPRSMMDGFAVRVADAGQTLPIAGLLPAGSVWEGELPAGRCLEILTGAPCPRGAEAIVPKEDIARHGDEVSLPAEIRLGQNIAPQGSECRAGQVVMSPGEVVTPLAVGVMASFSRTTVRAIPRPSLGIVTTGAELAVAEGPLRPGQIRDSNGPMLAAMAHAEGIAPRQTTHVADRLEAIRAALQAAADCDIVVLSGGVSVGTFDLVPQAIAEYGAEIIFHGVKQKPGKPMLFAHKNRQLLFGLPGNPLACHLGFHRYISAAIRKLSGRSPRKVQVQGELTHSPPPAKAGRTSFVLGWAEFAIDPAPRFRVRVLPGVSSADIFRGCQANCYVELRPEGSSPSAGDACAFTWLE